MGRNIRNRISPTEGFVSEDRNDNPSDFLIEHLANLHQGIMYVNESGTVLTSSHAQVHHEYHEHQGTQIVNTSSFAQIFINGGNDQYISGITLWDTGTSKFQPQNIGDVYTLRVECQVDPIGGNPTLHLDCVLSGSNPDTFGPGHFRHHQSHEQPIRATGPHIHLLATYTLFTDADLLASGAIIMAESTGAQITMKSASIMIKEG